MKIILHPKILADITLDMREQNVLWGLSRINEYLNKESLLRQALIRKYRNEIEAEQKSSALSKLLSGKTLAELNTEEQLYVKERSKRIANETRYVPHMQSHSKRAEALKRLRVA